MHDVTHNTVTAAITAATATPSATPVHFVMERNSLQLKDSIILCIKQILTQVEIVDKSLGRQ